MFGGDGAEERIYMFTQIFRSSTFSTFSEGSKGDGDFSDGMSSRRTIVWGAGGRICVVEEYSGDLDCAKSAVALFARPKSEKTHPIHSNLKIPPAPSYGPTA